MLCHIPTLLRPAALGASFLMISLVASAALAQGPDLPPSGDRCGSSLAGGDFNGDGIQDLAVGALSDGVLPARAVQVVYGTLNGRRHQGDRLWRQSDLGEREGAHDVFGAELSTADFDNDGFDDLVIGVFSGDAGASVKTGAIHILFGTGSGLSSDRRRYVDTIRLGRIASRGTLLSAVLRPGDVNGDAFPDLVVGTPGEDLAESIEAGTVFVLYGRPGGLSPVGFWSVQPGAEADETPVVSLTSRDTDRTP